MKAAVVLALLCCAVQMSTSDTADATTDTTTDTATSNTTTSAGAAATSSNTSAVNSTVDSALTTAAVSLLNDVARANSAACSIADESFTSDTGCECILRVCLKEFCAMEMCELRPDIKCNKTKAFLDCFKRQCPGKFKLNIKEITNAAIVRTATMFGRATKCVQAERECKKCNHRVCPIELIAIEMDDGDEYSYMKCLKINEYLDCSKRTCGKSFKKNSKELRIRMQSLSKNCEFHALNGAQGISTVLVLTVVGVWAAVLIVLT